MWLCLPTVDDEGLRARLSPHFGRAPFFTMVDTATRRVRVVSNPNARHGHGACRPVEALRELAPQALVCRGIGRRAFAGLAELDLPVYLADAWDVSGAVAEWEAGSAQRVTPGTACRGGHFEVAGTAESD
jgi:predicted Fe-Mo cluster-binding NifX family protein